MFNKNELEKCLRKVNIKLYKDSGKTRNVIDVLEELSKVWDVITNEHKQKIYEAMGILPPAPLKQQIYTGIRNMWVDDSITYLNNQPTCDDDLINDIRKGNDLGKYL